MPNVLLIVGSSSINSHSLAATRAMEIELKDAGCSTSVWDLAGEQLPLLGAKRNPAEDEHVNQWRTLARVADGFVIATPNYHNSFSGVLKNAIDLLGPADFHRKPVVLMSNSGGLRSVAPLDQLRIVMRALGGIAIPSQVATCDDDYGPTNDGLTLNNPAMLSRVTAVAEEMTLFLSKFSQSSDTRAGVATFA